MTATIELTEADGTVHTIERVTEVEFARDGETIVRIEDELSVVYDPGASVRVRPRMAGDQERHLPHPKFDDKTACGRSFLSSHVVLSLSRATCAACRNTRRAIADPESTS